MDDRICRARKSSIFRRFLFKKKRQFIISFSRMACWLPAAVSVSAALFTTDRMWGICFSYMKNFMVVVYLFQIRTRSSLILAHYLFMVCCELCIHNRVTTFAISFYVYLSLCLILCCKNDFCVLWIFSRLVFSWSFKSFLFIVSWF